MTEPGTRGLEHFHGLAELRDISGFGFPLKYIITEHQPNRFPFCFVGSNLVAACISPKNVLLNPSKDILNRMQKRNNEF